MKELGVGSINIPETNLDWKIDKVREEYGYRIKLKKYVFNKKSESKR